jgi:hypothetical protein
MLWVDNPKAGHDLGRETRSVGLHGEMKLSITMMEAILL